MLPAKRASDELRCRTRLPVHTRAQYTVLFVHVTSPAAYAPNCLLVKSAKRNMQK
jgi:hypothetical protein